MKYLCVEIDFINDFADTPRAALPVPGCLEAAMKFGYIEAEVKNVLSIRDYHEADNETTIKEWDVWPEHAKVGTWGADRIPSMLESVRWRSGGNVLKNNYDAWEGLIGVFDQGYTEKHIRDIIDRFDMIFVGGVVTGICVKAFIDGAIERGYADKLVVVSDCVANLEDIPDVQSTEELFNDWLSNGVDIMDSETVMAVISNQE